MENLTITLIQTSLFWEDHQKNQDHFRVLIDGIHQRSDLILLPEMFNTGFSINSEFCTEPMDGPSMLFIREMAISKQAAVATSLLVMDEGEYVNRLIFYYPDGRLKTYDKRHLFRLSEEIVKTITLNYEDMKLFRESFAFGFDWDTFTIH